MRKKEIEKASICQYQIIGTIGEQEAFKNGFVKGAEWADKTMIERVEQWLIKNNRGQTIGNLHRFLEEE